MFTSGGEGAISGGYPVGLLGRRLPVPDDREAATAALGRAATPLQGRVAARGTLGFSVRPLRAGVSPTHRLRRLGCLLVCSGVGGLPQKLNQEERGLRLNCGRVWAENISLARFPVPSSRDFPSAPRVGTSQTLLRTQIPIRRRYRPRQTQSRTTSIRSQDKRTSHGQSGFPLPTYSQASGGSRALLSAAVVLGADLF